jgi:two-component system cell cycle response regulator
VTLRTRLTVAFLLIVLVPLLLAGLLLFALLPQGVDRLQGGSLQSSAKLVLASVSERCQRVETVAATVATALTADDARLQRLAERLVGDGRVDGVQVLAADGRVLATAGLAPAGPRARCADAQLVRTGERAHLVATQPVPLPSGGGGTVVVSLAVDDTAVGGVSSAADAAVVLLDGQQPVAGSGTVSEELLAAALAEPGSPVRRDGRVAQLVRAVRGPGSLGVLVAQDSWLDLTWLQWLFAVGVLGSGLLAVGIASGLARATTSPLEALGRGASRVADGDLTTVIDVSSRDEVGNLATAFNRMTEKVRGQVQALEDSGRQLRAGVARLGDALGGTHDLDRILAVVLETAIAATGARAGAVLLRDAGSGELRLSAGRNLEERSVPARLRVPADVGITGAVARSGRSLHGRSGPGRGELPPGPGEPSGAPVVAVPLTGSGAVIGVLLLWDRDGDEDFTEGDLDMLRTFTSQATVAVDNVLLHEEARRLSVTDGLTGLANYRGFTVTVGKEIERAVRFERPLALLLLDLDHFKLVNDVWGHPRGDAVLVELAGRVRAQVRDVDTLARYGGEEFVVVLPETDRAGAVQAAERICAAVRRRPFGEDGEQPIDVTLSLGIAVYPDHGTSSTTLLRRADEALYAAKRGGRDGWRLASAEPAADAGARPS